MWRTFCWLLVGFFFDILEFFFYRIVPWLVFFAILILICYFGAKALGPDAEPFMPGSP